MTIPQLKQLFVRRLAPIYGEREAGAVFLLVAEKLLGIGRSEAMLAGLRAAADSRGRDEVTPQREAAALGALDRLVSGEPVQYVLGYAQFCGMEFAVDPRVLIPRPETEELVRLVAREWKGALRILDIGTGSGAIAVSLAGLLPGAEVFAVDISDGALAVAGRNAAANGVAVGFVQADILSPASTAPLMPAPASATPPLSPAPAAILPGRFDVIVSNPPYLPTSERGAMVRNVVGFEPHLALFVEDGDPLVFYRAIARFAADSLACGGGLYFEINEKFGAEVCALLGAEGFPGAEVIKDINGKDRIVRWRQS